MNADQFLALADTLRAYAQHCGRDMNASNMFVHSVLMRAIRTDGDFDPASINPRTICEEAARQDRAA